MSGIVGNFFERLITDTTLDMSIFVCTSFIGAYENMHTDIHIDVSKVERSCM